MSQLTLRPKRLDKKEGEWRRALKEKETDIIKNKKEKQYK